jgi:hypothetical protein
MILLLVRLDQTFPGLWESKAYGASGLTQFWSGQLPDIQSANTIPGLLCGDL